MYEQVSHSLLNRILSRVSPELQGDEKDLLTFYIRLGANFYAIHNLFSTLYGEREDFEQQLTNLVERLARGYLQRPADLKELDGWREKDYNWFLSQKWTGMALYCKGFAGDLKGLNTRLNYFEELGVNLVHIMPMLKCPEKNSDGGYAVSDFRQLDPRAGSLEDLDAVTRELKQRDILLVLDVVVNHTSNRHQWAEAARQGDSRYQDYYYLYDNRAIPDQFEQTMLEVFPTTSPGNFTWDETMQKWVMTVFHDYQWDLNYHNPEVFIEMIDIILYWANRGADIIRLDAVAFLWKRLGTSCQNLREAHLLLQLMKDCCQVTAPGLLFIAEAIVAPSEINKYFGEDAVIAKECEIAYNATFMALLWDAIATRNCKLLNQAIANLPVKLDQATWLNYVRCHDDIGLGFADSDILQAGYDPGQHRKFLVDFYTGNFPGSPARGMPFAKNEKTGDARISGTLASLAGLESALEDADSEQIDLAVRRILLLHSLIMSFGGIPLLYYGDELATINDYGNLADPEIGYDNRWIHRPQIDWKRAEQRAQAGTVEYTVFEGLKEMIAVRRETPAFADFNNRELLNTGNEHLFAFIRYRTDLPKTNVLVVANFDVQAQGISCEFLRQHGFAIPERLTDLLTGKTLEVVNGNLLLPGCEFAWLSETQ
ncbi:MAG: amylosucrase [Gammaproteobacteria bacterium]|nr:alpha-amylase [Pseudomonadales bacterium]